MATESPRFRRFTYAPDKVSALLSRLIESEDGFLLAFECGGTVVGFMAAMAMEHWMAAERMASDFGVYVDPRHRGGTAAWRMIRKYIIWADERKALETTLGVSTDDQSERTDNLYYKLGLIRFGSMWEVPHV